MGLCPGARQACPLSFDKLCLWVTVASSLPGRSNSLHSDRRVRVAVSLSPISSTRQLGNADAWKNIQKCACGGAAPARHASIWFVRRGVCTSVFFCIEPHHCALHAFEQALGMRTCCPRSINRALELRSVWGATRMRTKGVPSKRFPHPSRLCWLVSQTAAYHIPRAPGLVGQRCGIARRVGSQLSGNTRYETAVGGCVIVRYVMSWPPCVRCKQHLC